MAMVMQRRRRWLLFVGAAIILVATLVGGVSGFYIDLLWFHEVGFSTVFWTVWWSKVVLGLVFGAVFFVLLLSNLLVAQRLAPRYRPFSPEQEIIERYRVALEPYVRWILIGFSLLIAVFVGLAASSQWQPFLLWRSAAGVSFEGITDPLFGRNPAFYIFTLPFYSFVQGWLFSALVGVSVIVAVAHYLTGGIRTQTPGEKVTPAVRAHLSVLFGLIALVKAWGYYLGRFDLLVSPRGTVTGASYTDVHAQRPALTLLVVIALACAVLFLVNIRYRIWALPILGIALLGLTSIVAGGIFPAAVQQFSVKPQELQREQPFIERNIAATRFSFGLDQIQAPEGGAQNVVDRATETDVEANRATIENLRVWNPEILRDAYLQLQRLQPYYEFHDVDVDRYPIDGEPRVVMLSPREVSQNGLERAGGANWQNQHLVYTHGFGAVASQVNTASGDGAPVFLLQNIPPDDRGIPIDVDEGAQLYYQEVTDAPYVIVGGREDRELNYPVGGRNILTRYQGEGGISIGSFFRQLLFAYRYRDVNLLISGLIDDQSRILIYQDIRTRVRKAAPFLEYDGDPYAAIVDGKVYFIWDAYTTTDRYPYGEQLDLSEATQGDLGGVANYIRNSVKVVVDAYDGTMTFYIVDPEDPLIQVWANAFPDLFETGPVPEGIEAHFRYPENLLQIQATQYSNYHVTDASTFFKRSLPWDLPQALSPLPGQKPTEATMRPYYVLLKLPGDVEENFVLFMPMTPLERPNMVAYLAARSDPENYGEVMAVEFARTDVDGPQNARARIDNDPNVSREVTLLSQQGSKVKFGDLLVVPIEDSFLYVQPIFVESSQENAIPELKRVALVNGGTVSLADSLDEALTLSFGGITGPPEEEPPPEDELDSVAQLLAEAERHFDLAETALLAGDLATYEREIDLGVDLVRRANELAGTATASPAASPSPSPSPTG
jgi:uncharacterized membrane protein (UPF0182 family)